MSLSERFIDIPDSKFFLRHVVMINYAGKVYVVLRGIEIMQTEDSLFWWLLFVYTICMLLGMYWYTRFWLLPEDLESFYTGNHVLRKVGTLWIIAGAATYYVTFAILFFVAYFMDKPAALSFALWNTWCWLNLEMAWLTQYFAKKPKVGKSDINMSPNTMKQIIF